MRSGVLGAMTRGAQMVITTKDDLCCKMDKWCTDGAHLT